VIYPSRNEHIQSQIVFLILFSNKRFLGEMAILDLGKEIYKTNLEHLVVLKSKEMRNKAIIIKHIKGYMRQLKELPVGKVGTM
jgi:hypothetical protein